MVGIPTLRLDGMFAAVTTLAFALAASGYLLVREEFSWIPQGQLGVPYLFGALHHLAGGRCSSSASASSCSCSSRCTACATAAPAACLRALPANQRAASGYGVRVVRAKLTAFAVSGFIAGLAGCLLLVVNQQYEETSFLVPVSLVVFTSTAVGGLGSAFGAILGAAIVEGSTIYLPPSWQLFPSALGVLLVLILFPRGLAGLCYDLRDWALERLGPAPPGRRAGPSPARSRGRWRREPPGQARRRAPRCSPSACSSRSSCSTRPPRARSTS